MKLDKAKLAANVREQAAVAGYRNVYVVPSANQPLFTVSAQQRRALNLIWALDMSETLNGEDGGKLKGKNIWILGAGAAGLTCAAAAVRLGANATVFDRFSIPMHLQDGCHHRFLHPRVAEWPLAKSVMASANLPILNWSVGTAHEVRARLVDDYVRILNAEKRDAAIVVVRDFHILPNGTVRFESGDFLELEIPQEKEKLELPSRREQRQRVRALRSQQPDLVVVAVGFGVERTKNRLPPRSYWRQDALDQTSLDTADEVRRVLVCGTGDGGVTDFMRVALRSFDHGPFIDHVCTLLENARAQIEVLEQEVAHIARDVKWTSENRFQLQRTFSIELARRYCELGTRNVFDSLDSFLRQQLRPNTRVDWIGYGVAPYAMAFNNQPLHRLLAFRLLHIAEQDSRTDPVLRYREESPDLIDYLDQETPFGCRYKVLISPFSPLDGKALLDRQRVEKYHDVIVRFGPNWALAQYFAAIDRGVTPASGRNEALLRPAFMRFWKRPPDAPKPPQVKPATGQALRATCLHMFEEVTGEKLRCLKLRVFLSQKLATDHPQLHWATYTLYSSHIPITRRVLRGSANDDQGREQPFALSLFTYADYAISVRLSDGQEFGPYDLSALLPDDWDAQRYLQRGRKVLTDAPDMEAELRFQAHVTEARPQ